MCWCNFVILRLANLYQGRCYITTWCIFVCLKMFGCIFLVTSLSCNMIICVCCALVVCTLIGFQNILQLREWKWQKYIHAWLFFNFLPNVSLLDFSVPERPSFLNVVKQSLDSLTLEWGPPKKNNGRLTGYTLKYQPGRTPPQNHPVFLFVIVSLTPSSPSTSAVNSTSELGPLRIKDFQAHETSFTLESLNSSMLYKLFLSARTIKGPGPNITEEAFTVIDTSELFPLGSHIANRKSMSDPVGIGKSF